MLPVFVFSEKSVRALDVKDGSALEREVLPGW